MTDITQMEMRRRVSQSSFPTMENNLLRVSQSVSQNMSGKKEWRYEKNWVPFEYEGELFFSLTMLPLIGSYAQSLERILVKQSPRLKRISIGISGTSKGGLRRFGMGITTSLFHSWMNMPSVQSNGKNICHYLISALIRFRQNLPLHLPRSAENLSSLKIFMNLLTTKPGNRCVASFLQAF